MSTLQPMEIVVGKICSIPADFRRRGDVSVVYLLEQSGYAAAHDAITPDVIQKFLQMRPEIIDDWFGYSSDKRCDSGWYFVDSQSEIGHFSSQSGKTQVRVFDERAKACAEFIKHELESIRANPSFGSGRKSLGSHRKKNSKLN